ncbi:(R,S)-reticuline 7-O-methyltransferase-like [Rhodamnia argentea]|uniref:(R,S)-reticuline 7-O-methyltransferase-like n=1 Tax=Rhodamnia argentea TaxID=178133 RepID=A0ABM3HMQ2_9MYRT|nr:(R,S)-reticuline 7-O-methyltransferase-like [Rhodamnia argentea]
MACTSRILVRAIVEGYKERFERIGSLVNVGGGIGEALTKIIKSYPHLQGINFNLPHVVATAPAHNRVTHVGGDMFETITHADAVFMKGRALVPVQSRNWTKPDRTDRFGRFLLKLV